MKATPVGAVAANVLSLGTRALGYFLFAVALAVYRRDPRFLTLFACAALAIGILVWWAL